MNHANNRTKTGHRFRPAGFSLIEVLCVIAIIGILTGLSVPIIRGLDRASASKSKRNAQITVELSSNLSTLNVAHVLPPSLGGAQATTRLLQTGIVILEGELEGAKMGMHNLAVDEIEATASYIEVVLDDTGPRLQYKPDK